MADFAMCHQERCALAGSCRRFLASAGARQSWILPLQTGRSCPFYWPQHPCQPPIPAPAP